MLNFTVHSILRLLLLISCLEKVKRFQLPPPSRTVFLNIQIHSFSKNCSNISSVFCPVKLSRQNRVHINPLSATGKTRREAKCSLESKATDPAREAKVGGPYLALSPQALVLFIIPTGYLSRTEASKH